MIGKAIQEFLSSCLKEDPEDRLSSFELTKLSFVRDSQDGDYKKLTYLLERHSKYSDLQETKYLNIYYNSVFTNEQDFDSIISSLDDWEFSTTNTATAKKIIDEFSSKSIYNAEEDNSIEHINQEIQKFDFTDSTFDIYHQYEDFATVKSKANTSSVVGNEGRIPEPDDDSIKPRFRPLHSDKPLLPLDESIRSYPNPFENFLQPENKRDKDVVSTNTTEAYTPIVRKTDNLDRKDSNTFSEPAETSTRRPSIKLIPKSIKVKPAQIKAKQKASPIFVDDSPVEITNRLEESLILLDKFEQLYCLI